jgi:predicted ATP-grasp superfamily ATP-dependent carboligase
MAPRVLICGVSTRAAAESAARAGFAVTALDAYADRDQHPAVRALSSARDFGVPYSAPALARASRIFDCDAVVYLSSFENHRRAVATLSAGRQLWGNAPDVLRRVRDPATVAGELRRRGFAVPEALASRTSRGSRRWLLKPRASGGGHRIRSWQPGDPVPRAFYVQERIDGVPGSIVFVAAAGRAVPIGISRQLVGDPAFGAFGYRYCGTIMDTRDPVFGADTPLSVTARALADATTEAFGLIGVNGIDFVANDDVPYPVEVNPRWSSSMELVERASGLSVFAAHAAACTTRLSSLNERRPHFRGAIGKAIVFARRDVRTGDTRAWLDHPDVRDVPHAGDLIEANRPVCTLIAEAPDAASCYAALVDKAAAIYAQMG